MKMNKQYYDDRIEAMIISKVATLRLDIRDKFRARHHEQWPELLYTEIAASIRDLRMWQYLAKIIDNHTEPYSVYIAKQLTNDARRNR
jgi:hypothetical protein